MKLEEVVCYFVFCVFLKKKRLVFYVFVNKENGAWDVIGPF